MMASANWGGNSVAEMLLEKNSPEVGKRIRQVRGALTQAEFGQRMGVSQAAIAKYEAGRIPKRQTLLRIAEAGQVSTDWVLTGRELVAEQHAPYAEAATAPAYYQTDNPDAIEILRKLERNPSLTRKLLQLFRMGKPGRKLLTEILSWDKKRISAFLLLRNRE